MLASSAADKGDRQYTLWPKDTLEALGRPTVRDPIGSSSNKSEDTSNKPTEASERTTQLSMCLS